MRSEKPTLTDAAGRRRQLVEGVAGFALYGGVSLLGRRVPFAFHLMGLLGFAIPLLWGRFTGRWEEMGFTRRNWRAALAWGLGGGVLTSLLGLVTVGRFSPAADPWLRLAIAVPFALLLASPFQEFFFRGWLQPRFEDALGGWGGLLVTTGLFTLWHYLAPMQGTGQSSFPLDTLHGFLATFAAGLAYGYVFLRTRSIVAPWLAHALALVTFVLIGAMVLVEGL